MLRLCSYACAYVALYVAGFTASFVFPFVCPYVASVTQALGSTTRQAPPRDQNVKKQCDLSI